MKCVYHLLPNRNPLSRNDMLWTLIVILYANGSPVYGFVVPNLPTEADCGRAGKELQRVNNNTLSYTCVSVNTGR
jgi:hypothetical protein